MHKTHLLNIVGQKSIKKISLIQKLAVKRPTQTFINRDLKNKTFLYETSENGGS